MERLRRQKAVLPPQRLEKRLMLSAFSIQRVSFNHDMGIEANGDSFEPSMSADGRWVAFESRASNLVLGDFNGFSDIYLFDRLQRRTTRVSLAYNGAEPDGDCFSVSMSADARFIAFVSAASNLVPDDNNGVPDVFVKDMFSGALARVSVSSSGAQADGPSFNPRMSADGRYVVFESLAANLVEGDDNGCSDIFLYDLATGVCRLISANAQGEAGDGDSYAPAISADGSRIAFTSEAANLDDGDINEVADIFVYEIATGALKRITDGNGPSLNPHLNADGRFLVFESAATNLVEGDINGLPDVFLADLAAGRMELISLGRDATGANGASFSPRVNADGSIVAFISLATNLVKVDINGVADLFTYERASGTTRIVNLSPTGQQTFREVAFVAVSPGVNLLAFDSFANNLVPGDSAGKQDCFTASMLPNAAPAALDTSLRAAKDVSLRFMLDASDDDGDAMTVHLLSTPAHGALQMDGLEATYTPAAGWLGVDTFQYVVWDGLAYSTPATVSISVEDIYEPDIIVVENSGVPNDDLIEFGEVEIGALFTRNLTIRNAGTDALLLTGWRLTGDGVFSLQPATAPTTPLAPGAQTTLSVRCQAFTAGSYSAQLVITSNDPDEPIYYVDITSTAVSTSGLIGSVTVNGIRVHIFDMDGMGVGKNIDGDFGPSYNPYAARNDVQILSAGAGRGVVIVMKNDFTGLGIAAEGPIAGVYDTRRIGSGDVAFIASTSNIGAIILNSYLKGADIGGLEISPTWTLRGDIDRDGSTADLTGIYCGGNLGVVVINGVGPASAGIAGDIVAEGSVNVVVCNGDAVGDVVSGSRIGTLYVGYKATRPANLIGNVASGGAVQTIIATGDCSGAVRAQSIGLYYAMGSMSRAGGSVQAADFITSIYAGKGVDKDVVVTGGPLRNIVAMGGDLKGDFEAAWFDYAAAVAGNVRANFEATAAGRASGVISARGRFVGSFRSEGSLNVLTAGGIGLDSDGRTAVIARQGINVIYSRGDVVRTDIGVGTYGLEAGAKGSLGTVYIRGAFRDSNIAAGCWGAADRPFPNGTEIPAPHLPPEIRSRVPIKLVYIGGAVGNDGAPDDRWVIAASGPITSYIAADKNDDDVLIMGNVT